METDSQPTYLTPPCFTAANGLHFSPLSMEIVAMLDDGGALTLAPIVEGAAAAVLESTSDIADELKVIGGDGVTKPLLLDDAVDGIDAACSALLAMKEHSRLDIGEWERFLATHGWDEWPPALHSDHDDRLEAAASLEADDAKLPMVSTFCWEHAVRRCFGEDNLLVKDREFFEAGLPAMCPDASFRNWGDLVNGLRGRESTSAGISRA